MGVVAARALLLSSILAPRLASAQETVMSTTVVPLASGAATSRTSFNPANPKPDRGLTLPSLSLTDDGNGPTVRSLLLQMPEADLGGVPVASSLGDQQLPAAIRAGALAGPALSSNVRGCFQETGNLQVKIPSSGKSSRRLISNSRFCG